MTATPVSPQRSTPTETSRGGSMTARLAVAWSIVGIPLAYGIYETVKKASALFS